jgi:hypothetical protein
MPLVRVAASVGRPREVNSAEQPEVMSVAMAARVPSLQEGEPHMLLNQSLRDGTSEVPDPAAVSTGTKAPRARHCTAPGSVPTFESAVMQSALILQQNC